MPEILVSDYAEERMLKLFNDMKNKKEEIRSLRMQANELEKELNAMEDKWNTISVLFDIEYETKQKDEIKKTPTVGFNFDSSINKHIH